MAHSCLQLEWSSILIRRSFQLPLIVACCPVWYLDAVLLNMSLWKRFVGLFGNIGLIGWERGERVEQTSFHLNVSVVEDRRKVVWGWVLKPVYYLRTRWCNTPLADQEIIGYNVWHVDSFEFFGWGEMNVNTPSTKVTNTRTVLWRSSGKTWEMQQINSTTRPCKHHILLHQCLQSSCGSESKNWVELDLIDFRSPKAHISASRWSRSFCWSRSIEIFRVSEFDPSAWQKTCGQLCILSCS